MGKIIQLDTHLSNQIAAWEVVERPVSIVKEWVENAIDAGSSFIKIEIEEWWKKLIQITDDGEGMQKDDLEICLKKYTTSKIKNLQDLYHIMTFWFRGEALASISSVSKFEIISKTRDSLEWYHLTFDTQNGQKIASTSCNTGTTLVVQDLFYNTPARLNYLKTDKTEHSKILDYLYSMTLSYPEIWFECISDGKKIFSFPKSETLQTRLYEVYGEEFSKNMLAIEAQTTGVQISGYISDPKWSFSNKNRQNIFVNHRPISSPLISKAIHDAYNRYIPHGMYPAFVVHIAVDPTIVDVNVHPRKQEVRFENEQNIFRVVYHALSSRLEKVSLLSSETQTQDSSSFHQTPSSSFVQKTTSSPSYYTGSGTKFHSYSPYKDMTPNPWQMSFTQSIDFTKEILASWEKNDFHEENSWDLHYTKLGKIIGQAFNSYILVERDGKLIMLDQHALAERVIYEKLVHTSLQDASQSLLVAEVVKLTPSEYDIFKQQEHIFQELWFEFQELSHMMISLWSIPNFIKKQDVKEIFLWILWDIQAGNLTHFKTLEEVKNKIFAYTACRSAIKFWNKLNLFEMNKLLNESVETYSATCPHWRPVIYEISLEDLKNKYER